MGASLLAKNDDTVLRLLINPDSLKTFGKIPVIPNRFKQPKANPHPSPLPEGEGTDPVAWARYADVGYRVELKF